MYKRQSLDLPLGFLDESKSNFHGARSGLILYQKSCEDKQRDLAETLDQITEWRLGMALADGDFRLPQGMQWDDIKWEWVPAGVPWWDPQKEIAGHKNAIAANLDTFERVCRMNGTDFYDNCMANAKAFEFARELGVEPVLATTTTASVNKSEQSTDEDGLEPRSIGGDEPDESDTVEIGVEDEE